MLIKLFKNRGNGSPRASMRYLLDKKPDEVAVLRGSPDLSVALAEGLVFSNRYTVGCLSFEERQIDLGDKFAIMDRFEECLFAGLEKDQFDITWVEHTDKGRLELNFFIPNVELVTGKRLQPYYDRADRGLVDSFKQVINHEYGLSSPDDPVRRQMVLSSINIPKDKREAQEAINTGLMGMVEAGVINSREDVLEALRGAGFEIARETKQSISIKTDGQNLRLKGAIYEQSFGGIQALREAGLTGGRAYERSAEERYQRARESLEQRTEQRREYHQRRYRGREAIDRQSVQGMEAVFPHRVRDYSNSVCHSDDKLDLALSEQQLLAGSSQIVGNKGRCQSEESRGVSETVWDNVEDLRIPGWEEAGMRPRRSSVQRRSLWGRDLRYSANGVDHDGRNRAAFREGLKGLVEAAGNAFKAARERYRDFISKAGKGGTRKPGLGEAIRGSKPAVEQFGQAASQFVDHTQEALKRLNQRLELKRKQTSHVRHNGPSIGR